MFIHAVVVRKQFCFGEEITDEVTSFDILPINLTRSEPACGQAYVSLILTFDNSTTLIGKFMLAVYVSHNSVV